MDNPTRGNKKLLLYPFPVAIWELFILVIFAMGVFVYVVDFFIEKIRKNDTPQAIEEYENVLR